MLKLRFKKIISFVLLSFLIICYQNCSQFSTPPISSEDLSSESILKEEVSVKERIIYKGTSISIRFVISEHADVNIFDFIEISKLNAESIDWNYTNGKKSINSEDIVLRRGEVEFPTDHLDAGEYRARLMQAASNQKRIEAEVTFKILDSAPQTYNVFKSNRHEAFPSLAKTKTGLLIGHYRLADQHEIGETPAQVMQVESLDDGRTWSEPRTIYKDDLYDCAPGSNTVALSNGTLLLAIHKRPLSSVGVESFFVIRSENEGKTWNLNDAPISPAAVPYGKIVELADNSLIMPAYGYLAGGGAIYKSYDQGKSWKLESRVVANDPELPFGRDGWTSFTETAFLPLNNGKLLSILRGNTYGPKTWFNQIYQSVSSDGGQSWSKPQPLFEGASPELVRLQDGRILLCVSARYLPEAPIGVKCHVSSNEGDSWSPPKMLALSHQNNSDSGYPSIILLKNGLYAALLYTNYSDATKDTDVISVQFHQNYFR